MDAERSALKLTVYTIGYDLADDCRMVLRELRQQTARAAMEIIVVAPDRAGLDDAMRGDLGAWQWVQFSDLETCGQAMAAAVRVARAPFVVYAEEHSYFDETWAERLIAAHERGYDAVGFAIENANPETLISWAQLYGQFGPLVAPVASRPADVLAGHHASYRTEMLLGYGSLMPTLLEDEAALFLDLRARDRPMFIAGDAISRHVNVSTLRAYALTDYLGQRSFAATRAKVGRWPWWKRGVYAATAPLIPWVRLRRIIADIQRTGRQDVLLPRILAPIVPALLVGAWGECLGYLLGHKPAPRKAAIELQREQFLASDDPWRKDGMSDPRSPMVAVAPNGSSRDAM